MGTARNAEVVVADGVGKWRFRSKQERREVVQETLQPGASVAVIARRHGVNANQVFHWWKIYREGRLGVAETTASELVPMRIPEVVREERIPTKAHEGVITLDIGRARVRIE